MEQFSQESHGSVMFGLILTICNFGLTVMDSSFWQKHFQLVQELLFLLIFNGVSYFLECGLLVLLLVELCIS